MEDGALSISPTKSSHDSNKRTTPIKKSSDRVSSFSSQKVISKSKPISIRSSQTKLKNHILGQAAMWVKSKWQVDAEKYSPCVFLNMFHGERLANQNDPSDLPNTEASKNFKISYKLFLRVYMRHWNKLVQVSNYERAWIESFLLKYSKLQMDEWKYICQSIQKMEIYKKVTDGDMPDAFPEPLKIYCRIIMNQMKKNQEADTTYPRPNEGGLLHSLLKRNDYSTIGQQKILQDALVNYICIYFENFNELWNVESIILTGALCEEISQFLIAHPIIEPGILKMLLDTIDEQPFPL